MRRPFLVLALCIMLSGGVAYAESPYTAERPITVVPAEVLARTLSKTAPVTIEVRFQAGETALQNVSISTFSNDGVEASVAKETPATLPNLPPHSEYSWRLQLTGDGQNILTDAVVHIRVAYDVVPDDAPPTGAPAPPPGGTAPPPVHQLSYAIVTIKPPASVAAITFAAAELKGVPETLAHERPGQAFVVVTNVYGRPLIVSEVRALGPSFVCLVPPAAADVKDSCDTAKRPPRTLAVLPGQSQYIDFKIEATSKVVPGEYNLIAAVDVDTADGQRATVMTPPQKINVIVLGESDVLKFIGIPSLLFLPGVLMLLTWEFLWSLGKPEELTKTYRLKWSTSNFWILAVALSLATALAYPHLTSALPGGSRDFVAAYGLLDFGLIFGFSVIATAIVYGVWHCIQTTRAEKRASEARAAMPSEQDGPREILEKLAKLNQDYAFDQYTSAANPNERLMMLEPWSPANGDMWLVPPAELTEVSQTDADAIDEADRLRIEPPTECTAVLAKFRAGLGKHWWSGARWRLDGEVRHPIKVPRQGWTKVQQHPVALIQGQ